MEKLQSAIAAYRARTSNKDLLELLDDAKRRAGEWEEMTAKERSVLEQYIAGFGPILDVMEGAVKGSLATTPTPARAPEDSIKPTPAPKPVPAPEDAPKATKPAAKPAPAVKTASQQMEELAEMFDGKERAEMLAQARAMREVEEIVRLAAEARSLGLGALANTMDDLAALMGG